MLDSFEKTTKEEKQSALKKHDKSELALLEARIHEAMGNTAKALEVLERPDLVVNRVAKHENLARIYGLQGNKDKAVENYE